MVVVLESRYAGNIGISEAHTINYGTGEIGFFVSENAFKLGLSMARKPLGIECGAVEVRLSFGTLENEGSG